LSGWLTLGVAALALFFQLGVRGLNEPDEGRYASVAYEMLRSGNWIEPHFQGVLHMAKPPLTQWLMALSMMLFGVQEWAVRLIPALAALGTVMLTWSLACSWLGPGRAFQGALILVSAPLFFFVARIADINMPLTFWVTLGIWAWVRWQEEGRTLPIVLFYAAHAGAFLTKGPVGCMLILITVLSFRLVHRDCMPGRRTWWWPGFLLAATAGLSWYALVIERDHNLLDYFLRYELYDRVFTTVHKRGEPFWFFWLVFPAGFLPWLPILAPLLRGSRERLRACYPAGPLLLALGLMLVFFTLSRSKLSTYVVPAYPLLALLATSLLARGDGEPSRPRPHGLVAVLLLAFATPPLLMVAGRVRFQWDHVLHSANLLALAAALPIAWWLWRSRRGNWIPAAAMLTLICYAALLDITRRHESTLGHNSSARSFIHRLRDRVAEQPGPVYYTHAPAGTEFYLQSPDPLIPLPVKSKAGPLTAEEYLRQLADRVSVLPEGHAYLLGNTSFLRAALAADACPEGLEVVEQGRKYTLLQRTGRWAAD
jgi:4-amino-4-deoxy-L-arabinose transferase-like glycosyltransferase